MVRYYAFPVVIGLFCIGALIGTAALIRRELNSHFRETLRSAQAAGRLPPEMHGQDVETMPLSDMGIELSGNLRYRVQLMQFITGFWFIWAPLIMIGCIGTAAFFRKD
jgi:hypothetical protein